MERAGRAPSELKLRRGNRFTLQACKICAPRQFPEVRKLLPRTRKCLFCDQIADSREHVIPEWLSKRMGIRDLGFQPAHYSETGGLELRPLIKCEHLTTKQVCGNATRAGCQDWKHGRKIDLDRTSNRQRSLTVLTAFNRCLTNHR